VVTRVFFDSQFVRAKDTATFQAIALLARNTETHVWLLSMLSQPPAMTALLALSESAGDKIVTLLAAFAPCTLPDDTVALSLVHFEFIAAVLLHFSAAPWATAVLLKALAILTWALASDIRLGSVQQVPWREHLARFLLLDENSVLRPLAPTAATAVEIRRQLSALLAQVCYQKLCVCACGC
jgi:hypothetical protein